MAIFTYHSPKIRKITNLFRQTNVHIAYKISNTIQQRTRPRTKDTTQDKDKSGINNLTCKTCKNSYIGQTSRTLTIRHREHTRYIKKNDPPIRIRITHTTKHPWIWAHQWHHVITQTDQQSSDTISFVIEPTQRGWRTSRFYCIHYILLYAFFWVIPLRLNFICRRFGTLSVPSRTRP